MKRVTILLLWSITLIACQGNPGINYEGGDPSLLKIAKPPAPKEGTKTLTNVDRMIIKNAEISFTTGSIDGTRKLIDKFSQTYGAYTVSEQLDKTEKRIQFEQVLRIPVKNFDAFLKGIEGLEVTIDTRNMTSEDVSEEFIDVAARLKAKKELETRYMQLFGRAKDVKEMLSIEDQLSNVRSHIESMQGRLNFLQNRVGYSTLRLTYNQVIAAEPGFADDLISSFKLGWGGLLRLVIVLASIWPFIILMAVGIWATRRLVTRKHFGAGNNPAALDQN